MTAELLSADLAGKAGAMSALADRLTRRDPYAALPSLLDDEPAGVLLLGTGGARYACAAAAERMRRAGLGAVAEYASTTASLPPGPDTLVVAVSLGSGLRELCTALDSYVERSAIIVLCDDPDSPVVRYADVLVPLLAGPERSGLACRGYTNALALLLLLGHRLGAPGASADLGQALRRSANAVSDLVERAPRWVPEAAAALDSPDGVHFIAPVDRLCSAHQAALAVRQGPVVAAHAAESAEWSHTGRHLAAISDYRAVLFAGSHYDDRVAEHLLQLRGAFAAVGAEVEGAAVEVRYPGDSDPDVRLLTEPVVGELLAAHWWAERGV
ncbi:glucosamine 6-phosphate synthetase-like amidotransferase/phosphosugar isomerase protein [Nocardiopsis mwathae]|uniref:Glucosamine 6-phosphate synthetase-like amidotransferase/phosphosugar isomerase protein n=1 Tax=Nocardiopsis mwathae TaxID=1472723 RepID=A0A7X0D5G0_9ACTN|nr:glucosamine 6-phosphate synthetase-like amidotransferase/phosphosugar isomerase protein [Nocardiopsis mwathae]